MPWNPKPQACRKMASPSPVMASLSWMPSRITLLLRERSREPQRNAEFSDGRPPISVPTPLATSVTTAQRWKMTLIPADCARVEQNHVVPVDIPRDGLRSCRRKLDDPLIPGEDSVYHCFDETIR